MRPDTTSANESEAAEYAAVQGRDEWVGGEVGDQEPNELYARHLGPDPWSPWTCPRCSDETRNGMPETCHECGWRNYG